MEFKITSKPQKLINTSKSSRSTQEPKKSQHNETSNSDPNWQQIGWRAAKEREMTGLRLA